MSTSTQGWMCALCGQYVPGGAAHACPVQVYTTEPIPRVSEFEQIMRRLDEIEKLIRKLR